MIYTVTFSPAIDYVMDLASFKVGEINRSVKETYLPGGKGINVSIVLANLGAISIATGFTGGFTGEFIKSELSRMGVVTDFIEVQGNSRINVKINAKDETAINGQGSKITKANIEELIKKLEKIGDDDILVISGAIPSALPVDTYENILKRLQDKKIKIVVDCTKETLLNTLSYHPFMVKPNLAELEEVLDVKINSDKELEEAVAKIIMLGAENVIVSLGADGAFMMGKNLKPFKIKSPKGKVANTVGAGDSLIAGFLFEYEKSHDFESALKYGVATGSASAYSEKLATKEQVQALFKKM